MRHLENKSEMAGNPVISIITLNVNSLNNPKAEIIRLNEKIRTHYILSTRRYALD